MGSTCQLIIGREKFYFLSPKGCLSRLPYVYRLIKRFICLVCLQNYVLSYASLLLVFLTPSSRTIYTHCQQLIYFQLTPNPSLFVCCLIMELGHVFLLWNGTCKLVNRAQERRFFLFLVPMSLIDCAGHAFLGLQVLRAVGFHCTVLCMFCRGHLSPILFFFFFSLVLGTELMTMHSPGRCLCY